MRKTDYKGRVVPQGAECQCVHCDGAYIFGGLAGFDRHVEQGHASPESLGMAPRERSGATVWVRAWEAENPPSVPNPGDQEAVSGTLLQSVVESSSTPAWLPAGWGTI